ncbi:MAG: PaaI family thioesterase [Desulfitobacteriaceae bacterium]
MEENTYRLCFVCGPENPIGLHLTYNYSDGEAKAIIVVDEVFAGYPGVAHGGIVTALLDEIMVKTIENLGIWAVTASMEVRFRHPTPVNVPLYLSGGLTKGKSKMFRTEGKLALEDGTILAEASAIFVKNPETDILGVNAEERARV